MTSTQFCFWLQGFFEMSEPTLMTEAQTEALKRHLALVFIHDIDPSAGGPEVQNKLNDAHGPTTATLPADVVTPTPKASAPPYWGGKPLIRC